jgi:hypothetical protein
MKEINYFGAIRIQKPSTLQSWIDKGWFKKELDKGYFFAVGCGRFKTEICKCSKCKRKNGNLEGKVSIYAGT